MESVSYLVWKNLSAQTSTLFKHVQIFCSLLRILKCCFGLVCLQQMCQIKRNQTILSEFNSSLKFNLMRSTCRLNILKYVSQHIERDQLSLKIKIDFLLFPKWLFFHLNFGAKIFEIGHCVLEIWQFYWGCHNRLVKSWFWEKDS